MKKHLRRRVANVLSLVMLLSSVLSFALVPSGNADAANPKVPLPNDWDLDYNEDYYGSVNAIYDATANAWFVEYFNVEQSFNEGDLFHVSFSVAGAAEFKQVALQSSLDGWDFAKAPKKWNDNGIANGTKIEGIIEVPEDGDSILNELVAANWQFKLHIDNEVVSGFALPTTAITLTDLCITPIVSQSATPVAIAQDKYVNFGTEYFGTFPAVPDVNGSTYAVEYFNVTGSDCKAGEKYLILCKISGASGFQQVALQNSIDGWAFNGIWAGSTGVPNGTVVGGVYTATSDVGNIAFKLHFDNPVTSVTPPVNVPIDISKLIVVQLP